jgi:hypothetical protein
MNTVQAAYSNAVRIGYIDKINEDRWRWSLNTIQPKGGRAEGAVGSESAAKAALTNAWHAWVNAAGLQHQGASDERTECTDPKHPNAASNQKAADQ